MKKIFSTASLLSLSLFLTACGTAEQAPPEEAGSGIPAEYILGEEDTIGSNTGEEDELVEDELVEEEDTESAELLSCQETNADLSLDMDSLKQELASCQQEIQKSPKWTESTALSGVRENHLQMIKDALLTSEQKEYPFNKCGKMGEIFKKSWYSTFSRQLASAKIRFSNGFLESEDLFGACQSAEGKMAFFLGAERDEDIHFTLLKFDTAQKTFQPALMLDDSEAAVVTDFGKREGPYVRFPSDDGRVFRYYYDMNIVVESP